MHEEEHRNGRKDAGVERMSGLTSAAALERAHAREKNGRPDAAAYWYGYAERMGELEGKIAEHESGDQPGRGEDGEGDRDWKLDR